LWWLVGAPWVGRQQVPIRFAQVFFKVFILLEGFHGVRSVAMHAFTYYTIRVRYLHDAETETFPFHWLSEDSDFLTGVIEHQSSPCGWGRLAGRQLAPPGPALL